SVVTGDTNGSVTEVTGGDLKAGMEVITGQLASGADKKAGGSGGSRRSGGGQAGGGQAGRGQSGGGYGSGQRSGN
ncbi:MAG: efflux RND transporter periplasmic adaptor subunit, partial [Pseudomonadota bacterium]|nr:efflux RND transporter periplasmic adaptor subunit [Pseudomonadota bacterium]